LHQCGTSLGQLCPKCAFGNASEARFCAQCAAPLDDALPVRAKAESIDGVRGERRHLTVMFCDLVTSSRIAAELDPEEWREVLAHYQREVATVITRFGGQVAKILGDSVMAFFGYPKAH
jgi:class 3 adenylate cyclase